MEQTVEQRTTKLIIKPGWQTSEFWLTVAMFVFAAVITLTPGMPWYTIVAVIGGAAVKGMMYDRNRALTKEVAASTLLGNVSGSTVTEVKQP